MIKKVSQEFYIKEVETLLSEENNKIIAVTGVVSTLFFLWVGYAFTVMTPPVAESEFFDNLDDEVAGKIITKKKEEKKKEKKKEKKEKKQKEDKSKKKKLKEQDKVASKGQSRGGGDPKARVTSKGVLGIVSGKITGAAVANADPFGKGGFSSDLDALMAGSGGLKRGGGSGIGRAGAAGIGFGTGFGSGFGGGSGGVGDLLGGMGSASSVKLKKRGKIKAASPSSITGDAEGSARSKEAIRRVVMKRIGGLKYLYNKYLKQHPDLQGKITVKMVIAPSGTVIRAVVLESSLGVPELERAIVKRIKRWKFGRVPKGTATVIYPFNFSS